MTGRRIAIVATQRAELQEFAVQTALGHGELLVEVERSLISPGTELGGYNQPGRTTASYPGYAAVGTVVGLGPGGEQSLSGQRVFLFPGMGDSAHCHATHKVLKPGGMALPVPEDLDSGVACFARMVNIALTPYCNADQRNADTVLVVGLGLVGNMVGQVGRIRGFRVLGLDPDAVRRQRARDAGFEAVLDPEEGDPIEAVEALTEGQGASLVVNATGRAGTFPMCLEAAALGGEVSTLGGARHGATGDLQHLVNLIHTRHLTLRGGWEMLLPWKPHPASKGRSIEENLRQGFAWLRAGAIRLEPIWTHTLPAEEFGAAYDALNRQDPACLGVVVHWGT